MRMRLLIVTIGLVGIGLLRFGIAGAAGATTRTVCSDLNLCDHLTVADALAAAADGDVIQIGLFPDAVVTLTEANVVVDKNVTIRGTSRDVVWQAASAENSGVGRHMHITGGTIAIIETLTLRHGDADRGGAIKNDGTLTLNDVTLTKNQATIDGGAVWNGGNGVLTLQRSLLSENSAVAAGGALYLINGLADSATIDDVAFVSNSAEKGGAIAMDGFFANGTLANSELRNNLATLRGGAVEIEQGTLTISDSTLSDNQAPSGGGIYAAADAVITIDTSHLLRNSATGGGTGGGALQSLGQVDIAGSSFMTNTAVSFGGAIYQYDGSLTLAASEIRDNRSMLSGGGIATHDGDPLTVTDSTIAGNVADSAGGGIYATSGTVIIQDSNIDDNESQNAGGGVFGANSAEISIQSTTIANNKSTLSSGGGIAHSGGPFTLQASQVNNNSAGAAGGAIFASGASLMRVEETTLSGNTAQQGGGGVYYNGSGFGRIDVARSLLVLNSAGTGKQGGGVYGAAASVYLANTTLSGNIGASQMYVEADISYLYHVTVLGGIGGVGVATKDDSNGFGLAVLAGSVIADHLLGDECSGQVTQLQGAVNLAADSTCNVSMVTSAHGLQPLAENGGPTRTHKPSATSPVVDAAMGDTCSNQWVANRDQRGLFRPNASACDLGAVEWVTDAPTAVRVVTYSAEIPAAASLYLLTLLLALTASCYRLMGVDPRGLARSMR